MWAAEGDLSSSPPVALTIMLLLTSPTLATAPAAPTHQPFAPPIPPQTSPSSQRLKADFEFKRGTGVPVLLMVHEKWIATATTRKTAVDFLKWSMSQPDTWALTYRQYIEWRKAPAGTNVRLLLGWGGVGDGGDLPVSPALPSHALPTCQLTPSLLFPRLQIATIVSKYPCDKSGLKTKAVGRRR